MVEVSAIAITNLSDSSVAENAAYTSSTPSLSGTPIGAVTYSLGGADSALFTLNTGTGVVSMVARNFESPDDAGANNVYNYTLTATDADGNSADQAVVLSVVDFNDNAPVFSSGATGSVPENAATTREIYTASTTDADGTAANRNVVYSLKAATGDIALLDIDSATGKVTLKNSANYEAKSSYSFTVVATNVATSGTLSTEQAVIANVTNVNDAPTVSAALASNASEGDSSYTVNLLQGATDADAGETATLSTQSLTYQVNGGTASATLPAGVSITGNTLTVDPANAVFNSLAFGQSQVIVASYQVTDVQGASVNQTATLTISGTNDAPTLSANTQTASYANDATAQTVFSGAFISAVDAGQTIKGLKFTVSGITDASSELITVDGTEFSLTHATSGTTAAGSIVYSVTVTGSTATITLTHTAGLTAAQAQALVNGIAYRNSSTNGMSANRVVTLTEITDSGIDNNVTTLNLATTLQDALAPNVVSVANNVSSLVKIGTGDVTYTYTFSEVVTGLTSADFTVTHGTVASISGSGTTWTVVVTPAANVASGKLVVVLNAGSVQDSVGNTSLQHTDSTVSIDTVAPVVSINTIANNDIVNAAKKAAGVTVSGTSDAEVGQDVSVAWGGISKTGKVLGDGTWQVTFAAVEVPGDVASSTMTANVSDQAGNAAVAATRSVRIDTTAPTISITPPLTNGATVDNDADAILNKAELDAVLPNGYLAVIGVTNAEAGQTVTAFFNSKSYTATVIAGTPNNTWAVQVPKADLLALAHGNSYSISATVSDAAGNPVATPASSTLEVKLAPPDVPTVVQLNTNDLTPVITGLAQKEDPADVNSYIALEAGDAITVTVGGQTYTLTLGANAGASTPAGLTYSGSTWSLAVPTALTQGQYNVGVSVNAVGYSTPKTDISSSELVIKTDAPAITINTIAGDNVINIAEHGGAITLSGTATDNIPGVTPAVNTAAGKNLSLTLAGVTYSDIAIQSDGTWHVDVPAASVALLSAASYSAVVNYTGVYGNTGSQSQSLALDLVKPATPDAVLTTDTGVTDAAHVTQSAAITAPTNTEADATLQYRITKSGETEGAWGSYAAPTVDGAYTVEVRQTDAAGNPSDIQTLSIVLDNTAPVFGSLATANVNENVAAGTVVYTANASDANAGVVYSLKAGVGDAIKFTIDAATGQVKLQEVPNYEGQISYAFTVVATDKAGNATEQAVAVTVTDVVEVSAIAITNLSDSSVAENAAYTSSTPSLSGT
ncbi:hypothetical protein B9Z45_16360, partial [Limnohabitans sp. 2KL-17]